MPGKKQYEVLTLSELIKIISSWVVDVILVIFLALALSFLFGSHVKMEGNSMTPTLESGDALLIDRTRGKLLPIRRFDIIAYQLSPQSPVALKRVLALPGERLLIREGQVYINGEALPENSYTSSLAYSGIAGEEIVLSGNDYFVIGENADASLDSRFPDVGNIRGEHILGIIWLRYAPFQNLRLFFK